MRVNYAGLRFGRLLVQEKATRKTKSGNSIWLCICDCGMQKEVVSSCLRTGDTTSCGCLQRELMSERTMKHGHSVGKTTATYNSWAAMVSRCTNQNYYQFANYGGRGIGVAGEWLEFSKFLADMGERPAGKTLDRRDNELGYNKENCRWATPKEQAANRRVRRDSKKHLMKTIHNIDVVEA